MIGSPGETTLDFVKTIWFIVKNRNFIDEILVTAAGIIPMSDWYLNPGKYGIIMYGDWEKNDYYALAGIKWRTKYFVNNCYIRAVKQRIMQAICNILL